jgi:hypothetical protein
MTGFTDRAAQAALENLTADYPYVALFTAVGSDAGSGFTEVSGGSYARVATGSGDWILGAGSAPSTISNSFDIIFPTATAGWGSVIAIGLFDAPTAGNLGAWDFLLDAAWSPCTVSNASPGILTAKNHGLVVADTLVFSTEFGGTAPAFSQSNFTGLLSVAHATTDTFDVTNSATQVNTSSTGSGTIRKVTALTVNSGIRPLFSAGQFVIECA